MNEIESALFLGSVGMAIWSLKTWYSGLSLIWPPDRSLLAKRVFKTLPFVSGAIMFFTLTAMASFDVIDSLTFVIFYMPLGYVFIITVGIFMMLPRLDIFFNIDALDNNNAAAVPAISGTFIAATLIYSGANVGDGPGWWCVVFATLLGFAGWFILCIIFNKVTGISERVTVGRDAASGIRWGCYMVAAGIIFARASAGDWSGFGATVVEFLDGWWVLPLAALMVAVERLFYKNETGETGKYLFSSVILGASFIAAAALTVIFLIGPLPENPIYNKQYREEIAKEVIIELDDEEFNRLRWLLRVMPDKDNERYDYMLRYATENGLIPKGAKPKNIKLRRKESEHEQNEE